MKSTTSLRVTPLMFIPGIGLARRASGAGLVAGIVAGAASETGIAIKQKHTPQKSQGRMDPPSC
jgi:hypothetical protein